jgi:hypothetical protein
MTRPLRILVFADDPKGTAATIHDHLEMFRRHSRHDVRFFNPRGLARSRFLDLDAFDVLVLHYSLVVSWDAYLSPALREQIRRFDGLTVQFLQDEYRFVDEITKTMRDLAVDVLYSVAPPRIFGELYGERLPGTEILPTLTGYVPDRLVGLATRPLGERPIDVGYRGRSVPFWLGRLGFEKLEIGRGFLVAAAGEGLRTDIAWWEGARIYGRRWNEFVSSCKATLTSESGSSIVDYDGSVERAVRSYLVERPSAKYEEVEERVLHRLPPTPEINALSPRLFEAAALRTGMVMFPGEYSGAVEPWQHYIPLAKDFSNVAEVAERIRDTLFLTELTERAYEELIGSRRYSEQQFVERFDAEMDERARRRPVLARHRRSLLRGEQALAWRGRDSSALRAAAREAILFSVSLRAVLRTRSVRRLLPRVRRSGAPLGAPNGWADLVHLAILVSAVRGLRIYAGEPFHLVADWDEQAGRLTLVSRPGRHACPTDDRVLDLFEAAAGTGRLREIVWSHAGLDQLLSVRFAPGMPPIRFYAGDGYDAHGIYRFGALVSLARERPRDVVAALAPLVASPAAGGVDSGLEAKRGARQ